MNRKSLIETAKAVGIVAANILGFAAFYLLMGSILHQLPGLFT